MKLRDLFSLLIKVFSLYFLVQFIAYLPYTYSAVLYAPPQSNMAQSLFSVMSSLINLVLPILLIIASDSIAKLLLGKHQSEVVLESFKMHRTTVLTITIALFGGYLIIDELPNIIYYGL